MIRQARQTASVYMADAEGRPGVEALLAHHLLGVHAPALDELRGLGEHPGQRRVMRRDRELQVVARVRLVDAGVGDRRAVVLAHRVRVVVDGRRDDVDAALVGVEAGGREVGRERHHRAQVLGGRDDLDPLVVRDRGQVVLDEVGAGARHDVAVAVERLVERGRPVVFSRSMSVGRSASGSSSRAAARRALEVGLELVLADLEDRVGVEVAERPQPDQLVVALGAQRPVVARVGDGLRRSSRVRLAARRSRRRWPARAASSSAPSMTPSAAARTSANRDGRSAGVARLGALPDRDLWPDGAGLRPARGTPAPASSRSAIRARRSASGAAPRANSEEDRVAELAGRRAAPLPAPDLVALVQVETEVVQLEVALEPGRRGEAGVVERLDRGEVRAVRGDLGEHGVAARVAQPASPRCGCRDTSRGSGCPTISRRTRVSTRSYRRSSSGPASRRGSGPRERDRRSAGRSSVLRRPRCGRAPVMQVVGQAPRSGGDAPWMALAVRPRWAPGLPRVAAPCPRAPRRPHGSCARRRPPRSRSG